MTKPIRGATSWEYKTLFNGCVTSVINSETTKIDTLIEKCETAIELLKERRTALISAAVTGKIDVRKAV